MIYYILGVAVILGICWFFIRSPRPGVMPLNIDKDDPLMMDAMKNAQSSIHDFKNHLEKHPKEGHIKVPFLSSNEETEYLWADVLTLEQGQLEVFLITPPVTHIGKVDRNAKYKIEEVVDWTVTIPGEKIKGGYTMQAMFEIYRQRYGELPKKLAREEAKYEKALPYRVDGREL